MARRIFLLAGSMLLLVALVGPVSAAGSPFSGHWVSTDTDGSSQLLVISKGAAPSVNYQDFYARSCDTHGDPSTHWVSAGAGEVDGDTLYVHFHRSGCGTFTIGAYDDGWYYDADSDTLTDSFGITWYRSP